MRKFILLLSLVISQVSLGSASEGESKAQFLENSEASACAELSEGVSATAGADANGASSY